MPNDEEEKRFVGMSRDQELERALKHEKGVRRAGKDGQKPTTVQDGSEFQKLRYEVSRLRVHMRKREEESKRFE